MAAAKFKKRVRAYQLRKYAECSWREADELEAGLQ